MKLDHILQAIGQTPVLRLQRLLPASSEAWLKLERSNPGGSLKDRIALGMVEEAERQGVLKPGGTIIEPTSGNTGVGLAMVAAVKGYRAILVMPESMSVERRRLIQAYGAQIVLTPKEQGTPGAIRHAQELLAQTPGAWMPQQFENPANPAAHAATAAEILQDFPEGLDAFVTGVGTGGHFSAVARALKEKFPQLKAYAVEPAASAVIGGGEPGPHPLQGIGTGFLPGNFDRNMMDEVVAIEGEEAYDMVRRAAREEGVLVGISTGATLAAMAKVQAQLPAGSRILGMNYDTGERYLSVEGLFVADAVHP